MLIVFGGSFNPPTIAHLKIVKKLLSTYHGSQVLLLPVGNDYLKPELIDIKHRIEMLHLLTLNLHDVVISDMEATRAYKGTLASLRELQKKDSDIRFVIGLDNLLKVKKWIKYQELLADFPLIVMNRNGGITKEEAHEAFKGIDHDFTFIDFDEDISATDARLYKEKRNELLTEEIQAYILKNHLYEE
ncbi:MAG: nicotinate (nicotinamide) nucleotide adenylyltransferase [Acholeplasmataceae bacterium]|nr:nicotinate (nicotinamide) nucleotide adenylyltransferase [Acholeplasmataceae bacterium]